MEGAMRMIAAGVAAGVLVSAALAAPAVAYAQSDPQQGGGYIKRVKPREHERIVITENVGYVPSFGLGYSDQGRATVNAARQSTLVTVDYFPRHAINIDVGMILMLNRKWGVGGTYTIAMFDNTEIVSTAAGFDSTLEYGERRERTGRLELTRVLYRSENNADPFDSETSRPSGYVIRVFGGPTYQRAKQSVITFNPNEAEMRKGSGVGYHAGIDLAMYTGIPGLGGGGIGAGVTVRYSGGSVQLPGLLDSQPTGRPAGGWNFGGGIRFRI
jgi:hypothetical protein